MARLKDLEFAAVDRTTIPANAFKGWREMAWITFCDRRYAPNQSVRGSLITYFFMLFLTIAAWAILWYLPLTWLGVLLVVSTTGALWWRPIEHANESRITVVMNLIIGGLGLWLQPFHSPTLFNISIPPLVFQGFVIAGAIAVLRRAWNYVAWQILGRLIVQYCKANQRYIPSKLANHYQ